MNLFTQTSNKFLVKRSVKQSKKITVSVVSNQVEIELISKSITEHANQSIKDTSFNELNQKKNHINIDEKRVYNDSNVNNLVVEKINDDLIFKKQSSNQKNTSFTRKSIRQIILNYLNVWMFKRKRFDSVNEEKIIEHRVKITRTITILLIYNAIESETNE